MSTILIIAQRNEYLQKFASAGATSPAHARSLRSVGCHDTFVFRDLVSTGVIQPAHDDAFYLNEPAARTLLKGPRRTLPAGKITLNSSFT